MHFDLTRKDGTTHRVMVDEELHELPESCRDLPEDEE